MRIGFGRGAPSRFVLFGADHLVALGVIAAATIAAIALVRRRPGAAALVRRLLATALLMLMTVALILSREQGESWATLAPLQLCDAAIFIAAWALLTLNPLAAEVAYFWGGAGTLLAVITPDLSVGFPAPEFFSYFALHGAVIVAAYLLPFGLGRTPRPGAVWRVLLVTNLYAALVGAIDFACRTNFLYLRAKPAGPTPLDWFGPWPVYLLVAELVAWLLFTALALPFRRPRPDTTSGR